MLRHTRTLATSLALGAAVLAGPAHAQSVAQTAAPAADSAAAAPSRTPVPTAAAPSAGVARDALVAGVQAPAAAPAGTEMAQAGVTRATRGQAQALMLVGGAALIVGLVVGGDAGTIFALGGAGIGLYGLYLYLQ
jgi:hypothetical protein